MGIEYQHIRFNTLQPAWSRGQFEYNGTFTDIPGNNSNTTGMGMFLLPPANPVGPGTIVSGGADQVYASNINKTYDERIYFATYFQDDWKINPKLTLNLGLRYDYFGPINETNGGQANFVWNSGAPNGKPTFIIPASGKDDRQLSTSFTTLLAQDGILLDSTNRYGQGLLKAPKNNFSPRFGFAYQVNPKLVVRGGAGLFWNAFENQGYGPNIGENYPFVYNFDYVPNVSPNETRSGYNTVAPVSFNTPYQNCPTAGVGGTATFTSGFSCLAFTPLQVNAAGLGLQGLQFKFVTPSTVAANLSVQYALTQSMSVQIGYVMTKADNLQMNLGANNVTALIGQNQPTKITGNGGEFGTSPFPDFGGGSSGRMIGASIYNGLQTKLEQQFNNGLNYLLTYTFSKTFTDAGDLLNGGSVSGARAPDLPGFGVRGDWGLASFNITNVFHFSGGYELPFGKDKHFLHDANKLTNAVVGGWSLNWLVTLQGGQPITLGCPTGVTAGTGCFDVKVPGESQKLGIKVRPNAVSGHLLPYWFGNPAAFQQPCQLSQAAPGAPLQVLDTPSGCVPRTGFGALGDRSTTVNEGPGFHRFDFSTFKNIPITERFSMQFRAEFFNIFNHPNFNAPGFGGNGVVAINNSTNFNNTDGNFGAIGSTRDAPFDPRQIQFALKLFY